MIRTVKYSKRQHWYYQTVFLWSDNPNTNHSLVTTTKGFLNGDSSWIFSFWKELYSPFEFVKVFLINGIIFCLIYFYYYFVNQKKNINSLNILFVISASIANNQCPKLIFIRWMNISKIVKHFHRLNWSVDTWRFTN